MARLDRAIPCSGESGVDTEMDAEGLPGRLRMEMARSSRAMTPGATLHPVGDLGDVLRGEA